MRLVKLGRGSKKPVGESWIISDDPAVHQKWIADGFNVGFHLQENGYSCVDFDTGLDPAREFFKKHRELCRVIVLTRRGVHFLFSRSTKTRKFVNGDVKGNGYTVFPPSTVNGHKYEFVKGYEWGHELAPFPEELFPAIQTQTEETQDKARMVLTRDKARDVRAYLGKVQSIQGQHGSSGLVRAAAICRDAGCSESEAMFYLMGWNLGPTVSPPWTPQELARAITRTYAKGE